MHQLLERSRIWWTLNDLGTIRTCSRGFLHNTHLYGRVICKGSLWALFMPSDVYDSQQAHVYGLVESKGVMVNAS